jgi:hypothetical protein
MIVDIINNIFEFLPEYTILAATIFSKMGSGTQSGKLLFKGICSDTNISISEDAQSIRICDTTTPTAVIDIENQRIIIGDSVSGITGSIFFANPTWNSIAATSSHKGLIFGQSGTNNDTCSLIIGGQCSCAECDTCTTMLGGYYNISRCNTSNSTIIASCNSIMECSDGAAILSSAYITSNCTPNHSIISSRSSYIYNTILNQSCANSIISSKESKIIDSRNVVAIGSGGTLCNQKHTAAISGSSQNLTPDGCYNTIIGSSTGFNNSSKNVTIIGYDSFANDTSFSSVIGSWKSNICGGTSSSILGSYCSSISCSSYSSIIGGYSAAIQISYNSSIISTLNPYALYNPGAPRILYSKNSSIISTKNQGYIKYSDYSSIVSSKYGCIETSKFSFMNGTCGSIILDSCSIVLMSKCFSYSFESKHSLIIGNYLNRLKCSIGSGIIGQDNNYILAVCTPVPNSGNFILGANDSIQYSGFKIFEKNSCDTFLCNNFINGSCNSISRSINSGILASYKTLFGCKSVNSVIMGSIDSRIISSTNSVIIGSVGVTMSNSKNSAIVASPRGKFLCNASETTRTGHLWIQASASIFISGTAYPGIECAFTGATISSISVCNGFIIGLT